MTSDDDPELKLIWKTMKGLGDALGQAQAYVQANDFILMEIVRDIAKSQPDPQKYLAAIFERISARADQRPIEDEAHEVTAQFRELVARFFSQAGKNLNKK
jgi:UTP-glucose-1-phosphate uridylyltransferase